MSTIKKQVSDIFTTMIPSAIENATVISSPELVTVASLFDINTNSSSEEREQESDFTTAVSRSIKRDIVIHSPSFGTPSNKNNEKVTESSKTDQHILFTTTIPEILETVKVIPFPESVTIAMELTKMKIYLMNITLHWFQNQKKSSQTGLV